MEVASLGLGSLSLVLLVMGLLAKVGLKQLPFASTLTPMLVSGVGLAGILLSASIYVLSSSTRFRSLFGPVIMSKPAEVLLSSCLTSSERGSTKPAKLIDLKNGGLQGEGCDEKLVPDDNQDSTETLMKSIRGIPYLIQAIQYSLETSLMNDMGKGVGSSVIHTAPGCTSVLDCTHESCASFDGLRAAGGAGTGGVSSQQCFSTTACGLEEAWEPMVPCGGSSNRYGWSNQQLRLAMLNRRASSSLAVFPFSESRPLPTNDSFEEVLPTLHETGYCSPRLSTEPIFVGSSLNDASMTQQHTGSMSRIAVVTTTTTAVRASRRNSPRQQIRCIGMSGAFLSRFNNSFRM